MHTVRMLSLRTISHGHCLVQTLVEDLVQCSATDLQKTLLLMPTRRLQLQVAAHLAARRDGASWLPQMATWDQFIQRESLPFFDGLTSISTALAELVFSAQIKELGIQGISEGHAHELLHFLQELWRHGKRTESISALKEWLNRQWQLDPEAQQEIEDRAARVYQIIQVFEDALHTEGYALQEKLDAQAIKQWLQLLRQGTWRPTTQSNRIIVAGLTSLPDCQLQLLGALANANAVEVWLDSPWQGLPPEAPLRQIRAVVAPDVKLAQEPVAINHVTRLQSAKDPFCEASIALERAQNAIARGIPPHRIGILVPDEPQYASVLATLSEHLGLRRNIPLSRPWTSTQAGGWITLLQRWVAGRESIALASLMLSPHSRSMLFSSAPDSLHESFTLHVSEWLRDAPRLIESKALFELSLIHSRPSSEILELYHLAWSLFQGAPKASIDEQAAHWETQFSTALSQVVETEDLETVERLAWQSLIDAESEVRFLPKQLTLYAKTWSGFISAVVKLAQNSSPRETGEPLADLQIISITEARYVPLDMAIIVGCVEGIFPHRVPRDALIDHTLKSALELPGWRQLEALEDSTFGLLISRVPAVELLWPEIIGETTTVRSRWVEKIHAAGQPIICNEPTVLNELFGKRSAQQNETSQNSLNREDDLEGQVSGRDSLLSKVSAGSLKALMSCPYQFLLRQRGIRPFTSREDEDPLLVGNLLHRVIEVCLKPHASVEVQLPESIRWRKQFSTASEVESWATPRLQSISKIIIPVSIQNNPEILQILTRSWDQLAADWGAFFELGMNPAEAIVEERFHRENPIYLDLRGRTIAVTGAIDVIHRNAKTQDWMICDYKTGTPPASAMVKQGLEPQLILYSMCLAATDDGFKPERGIITYRSLRTGNLVTISAGKDAMTSWKGPFGDCKLDLGELIATFSDQWIHRIDQINREQRFYADSSQCGYCEFTDVCRKDDPRFRDRIRAQETLP